MATLRKWLEKEGFDFENGAIIYSATPDGSSPGWDTGEKGVFIKNDHPILDLEFHDGFGSPECPRIIAQDEKCLYFPYQYDGATGLQKVFIDICEYQWLQTPYPGGG